MADDFSSGTATNGRITVGGPATAGRIETARDSDWFRVDVLAGQSYRFTLTAEAAGLVEATLELKDTGGDFVDFATVRDGEPAVLNYTPSLSGPAYLTVAEFNDGPGTGSYTVAALATASATDDYADDASTTGVAVVGGPSVQGRIEVPGDVDFIRVDLSAGTEYEFLFFSYLSGGVSEDEGLLSVDVLDADLEPTGLGFDVFGPPGIPNSISIGQTTTSGTHYLFIRNIAGVAAGDYSFSITGDDYAADASTTGVIEIGGAAVEGRLETAGDYDALRVELTAGQPYRFTFEGEFSGDPEWVLVELVDEQLVPTGIFDGAFADRPTVLDFTPDFSGSYFLGVLSGGSGQAGTGSYTVEARSLAAIVGTPGDDTLSGAAANDTLSGLAGDDVLGGGAGNDQLDGGAGADTMSGGSGNDHYLVDDDGDLVSEVADEGSDRVGTTLADYTLPAHVEVGRVLAGAGARLAGNGLDNVLYAGSGGDTLVGGDGGDHAAFQYANGPVDVSLATAGSQATGGAGEVLLQGIENLYGSRDNDQLSGDDDANQLNGGAGTDTLAGGGGDDLYVVHDTASVVDEAIDGATGGRDIVLSTARSWTLDDGVEDGRVHADGYTDLIGNAGRNLLYAGGFSSRSLLDGRGGNDTVSFLYADYPVYVDLNLLGTQQTTGSGIVKLASIENLIGSKFGDRLVGNARDNILNGGDGGDWLIGGAGRDVFRLNSRVDSDFIADFAAGSDRLCIDQSQLAVGNGDTVIDGAVTLASAAGFAASAELVVLTDSSLGLAVYTDESLGSATSAYAVGATALFMLNDGDSSALWLFTAANADAEVSTSELSLLADVYGTSAATPSDFLFGA